MSYENRVLLRHARLDFQNDESVTDENFGPTLRGGRKNYQPLFLICGALVTFPWTVNFPLGRMGSGSSRNNSLTNFSCLLCLSHYTFRGERGM